MSNVAVSDTRIRERRDFKIIDETDDYVVVDKPPLLLIHPTKPNGATTLWAEFGLLMQSRRLSKEYHAIVWGWPDWETTSVDAPLMRQGEIGTSKVYLKQM